MSVTFILFTKNHYEDLKKTYTKVLRVVKLSHLTKFDIYIINDGSTHDISNKINQDSLFINSFTKIINFKYSKGVANAVYVAANSTSMKYIFPLPGHDLFTEDSILKLLRNLDNNDVVLGFRNNKFSARPLLKYLASLSLNLIVKLLISIRIKDINGLNVYRTEIIRPILLKSRNLGHGNHIFYMKYLIRKNDLKMIQIPIQIESSHKKRENREFKENLPKLKNILEILKAFFT